MSNYLLTFNPNGDQKTPIEVDLLSVKKAALIYRAINHKLRQQILKLIDETANITVTDIYVKLRLEQSVASQHLAVLRKAGFVVTNRDGKYIHYAVNKERMHELNQCIEILLK